jgi:outer membrane receptor protein involved in Fe transport
MNYWICIFCFLFPQLSKEDKSNIKKPVLISKIDPDVIKKISKSNLKGRVILKLEIDKNGNVKKSRYLTDPGPGLGIFAQKLSLNFKFSPGEIDGKPVKCITLFTIDFGKTSEKNKKIKTKPKLNLLPKIVKNKNKTRKNINYEKKSEINKPVIKQIPGKSENSIYETTIIGSRGLTASSDQLIRNRDFLLFPRKTPSDLLLMVPQLHISQHSGSGKGHQIFLRGFDAEHGQDIYIGYSGIPLNEPSHVHGIGYTDLHFIIPEMIKTIEVLKGPYDVRYGNFATAGSVNFILKDSLKHSYISSEAGFFSTIQNTLVLSKKFSGLKTIFTVQQFSTKGYTSFGNWSGYRLFGKISKKLKYGKLSLNISSYESSWNSADAIPVRAVDSGLIDFYGGIDSSDGGSSRRDHIGLSWEKKTENGNLKSNIYFVNRNSTIFTNYTYFLNNPTYGDQTEQGDSRYIYGGRVEKNWKTGKFKFLAGVVYRSDNIKLNFYRTENRIRWDTGADVHGNIMDAGTYLRMKIKPTKWFNIIAGLRHDYLWFKTEGVQDFVLPSGAIIEEQPCNGSNSQNIFSPKLSFIITPVKDLNIFFNSGTGFHSLDMRDAVLNPQQEIPIAYAGEVGIRTKLWKKLDIAGAFWGTYLEQEIFFDPTLGKSINLGESQRTGFEFEARLKIFRWLSSSLDGSYTNSKLINSSDPIPNSPSFLFRGVISVRKKFRSENWYGGILSMGFRARYIGERDLQEGYKSEPVNLYDLLVRYRFKRFSLQLTINNLLNTKWKDAQFYYSSRVSLNEPDIGYKCYHFTAGTPFSVKLLLKVNLD